MTTSRIVVGRRAVHGELPLGWGDRDEQIRKLQRCVMAVEGYVPVLVLPDVIALN